MSLLPDQHPKHNIIFTICPEFQWQNNRRYQSLGDSKHGAIFKPTSIHPSLCCRPRRIPESEASPPEPHTKVCPSPRQHCTASHDKLIVPHSTAGRAMTSMVLQQGMRPVGNFAGLSGSLWHHRISRAHLSLLSVLPDYYRGKPICCF
jgi:hypothetical protein